MKTIKPLEKVTRSSKPFRWWYLAYLLVQNAFIIGALDWLLSLLFNSTWPVVSTYILVILIVFLTVIGYQTATKPKKALKKPDFEFKLTPKLLILQPVLGGLPERAISWDDISKLEWHEGNYPPAVLVRLGLNSPTHNRLRGAEDNPPLLWLELIDYEMPPLEIFKLLDYYWQNPQMREELER